MLVGHASARRSVVRHHRAREADRRARQIIPLRHKLYSPEYLHKAATVGDKLLADIRGALRFFDESNEYERSVHQKSFHESMLASCVRHIYKDEYDDNFAAILEANGWTEARQEIMICCPRRFGKTWATGMFVAAYAYCVPNAEVCIFSPSRRQSEKMLELVRTFLSKLPQALDRISKSNRERLWLEGRTDEKDVRKVSSYPSKVSTLKGVGGDLIICEEAAAMDTAVFYEVVVPLLELDRTALICISTILDPTNFYSKLLELKDENGDPFFVVHKYVMACVACQAAGTPQTCTHCWASLPPWQSARKHKKIRAMMADQPELLARETMGISSDMHQRAFSRKVMDALRARPALKTPKVPPTHLFLTVDPSGGGSSHFAIVSALYHRGTIAARLQTTHPPPFPPSPLL